VARRASRRPPTRTSCPTGSACFPDDAFEASTSVDEPDAASVDELAAEIEADEGDEGDDDNDDNADTAEDA
jgi:hypothetical protein